VSNDRRAGSGPTTLFVVPENSIRDRGERGRLRASLHEVEGISGSVWTRSTPSRRRIGYRHRRTGDFSGGAIVEAEPSRSSASTITGVKVNPRPESREQNDRCSSRRHAAR